jgi:hypothetical protein
MTARTPRATALIEQPGELTPVGTADDATHLLLADIAKLLKRTPKFCMDTYVGSDRVSFGQQAKALSKRLEAHLAVGADSGREGGAQ